MISDEKLKKIKSRGDFSSIIPVVEPIIKDVKNNGDSAVLKYCKEFDDIENISVTEDDIKEAYEKTDDKVIIALKNAASRIKDYAEKQMPKEWFSEEEGVRVGQIVRPLNRVGCYVPAGQYPLPSSVLMTAVIAKVAGVKEVIVCSPVKENNAVLVACDMAGVDKVFRVGGSQAIAAMAYGTATIPKVDKIVGPGNQYVTAAKKIIDVGIDFLAGPSEIMIFAESGNASFIAADLLSQCEHDKLASAICVTTSKELGEAVEKEVEKQLEELSNKDIAKESWDEYGGIMVVNTVDEAFKFINDFAPEHLEIMDEKYLDKVQNAGAIFIGEYSCESAGDYAVGPSHVLPTIGVSKYRAGLSVMDFVKMPSVQKLTKEGLSRLKDTIVNIAEAEGLSGHAKAVLRRFE